MSVGHFARLLEEVGIPTVITGIEAFQGRMEAMTVPRALVAPHPMGRTLGPPCDEERQRETILRALRLLVEAGAAGTVMKLGGQYRPPGCWLE